MLDHSTTPSLTQMERNALRYVAGYVYRKVRRNQAAKFLTNIQCLEEINGETDEDSDTEEQWRSHSFKVGRAQSGLLTALIEFLNVLLEHLIF